MAPVGAVKITRLDPPLPKTAPGRAQKKYFQDGWPPTWRKQLSAKALGVTKGRAEAIRRIMSQLSAPTRRAADRLILRTRGWRTKAGKPLAPTTRENMLSALCSGFFTITGRALNTPTVRAERRINKKALAEHVRRQAVPATKREIERLLRNPAVQPKVRNALRFMWGLALRAADLLHICGRDVLNKSRLMLDGAAVIRMRGVKGISPGSRGYHRYLPLSGLTAVLATVLAEARLDKPIFPTSRSQIVLALRKVNPKLSAHSVRRGSATHLANEGASMKQIRDHLGHQRLTSTRLYIQPTAFQRDACRRRKVAELLL